jgi:glycosyltransferase involved in cell wall biosynthesis
LALILLSWFILATWLVALLQAILNLTLIPRLRTRMPRRSPLVSVIVPARNEERTIGATVRGLLAQTYPALEVVVVDDRSTDATGAVLARIDDERLVVIHGEDTPVGWLGKPWALQQGSTRARGELLLFIDADVLYERDAIAAAVAHLEERDVPMITLFPRLVMRGFWEHIAMTNLSVFLLALSPVWLANRTRASILGVGAGTGNLVRRFDYYAAGGHAALRDAVVDDIALGRLLRRAGRHTEVVRADDYVSVRMYAGLREVIDGFTKNSFATFHRNYFVALAVVIGSLVFNLLPYVLMFVGDVLAVAAVALITLTRVILFVALRYRLDNAILGHPLMVLVWCWIMLRSIWLTGIRRRLHWRGRTYDAGSTQFGAD